MFYLPDYTFSKFNVEFKRFFSLWICVIKEDECTRHVQCTALAGGAQNDAQN